MSIQNNRTLLKTGINVSKTLLWRGNVSEILCQLGTYNEKNHLQPVGDNVVFITTLCAHKE